MTICLFSTADCFTKYCQKLGTGSFFNLELCRLSMQGKNGGGGWVWLKKEVQHLKSWLFLVEVATVNILPTSHVPTVSSWFHEQLWLESLVWVKKMPYKLLKTTSVQLCGSLCYAGKSYLCLMCYEILHFRQLATERADTVCLLSGISPNRINLGSILHLFIYLVILMYRSSLPASGVSWRNLTICWRERASATPFSNPGTCRARNKMLSWRYLVLLRFFVCPPSRNEEMETCTGITTGPLYLFVIIMSQ